MSADLETALRDMLHERAGDIATLPPRLAHPDQLADTGTTELLDLAAPHRPGHTSRWLLAAAVVLIVAIAGTVVGLRSLADHPRPAAPNTVTPTSAPTVAPSSPSPTPTTSHHLSEVDGLHAASCTVPLPAAWQHAIDAGTVTLPGYTLHALAMSPSGTVVADASQGHQHKLVLVDPDGSIRTLYASRNPSTWGEVDFGWAAFSGDQVAFTVLIQSHQGGPGPTQIDLIDTRTGAITVVRPSGATDGSIVNGVAQRAGKIYWTESVVGTVTAHEYDIDTRSARSITAGDYAAAIRGNLPSRIAARAEKNAAHDRDVDRGVYAWTAYEGTQTPNAPTPPTGLWLWQAGMDEPLLVSRAPLLTPALAMPYVISGAPTGGRLAVLDTRTGAVATIGKMPRFEMLDSGMPTAITEGGEIAMEIPHADKSFQLTIFSIDSLPGLHC